MKLIYKIIYQPTINFILRNFFKMSGKLLLKPIVISVSGKLKVSYKKHILFLHTNQTCYVSKEIFYNGAKNYEFTTLFEYLIKQSNVFFDIGANIGYFSVLGEKINPSVKIFAFEPSVGPLHYLNKNVKENKLKNVTVINKAVSNIDGRLEFYDVINKKYPWLKHNLNGSNSLQNKFGLIKSSSYLVDVTTLQSVIKDNEIKQIDLIKLDTECTEHLILQSSLDVINKFQPIIICEVYDVIEKEVQECIDKMTDYKLYHYIEATKKLNLISSLNEVKKDTYNRNFVFCPDNKVDKLDGFIS
ncbi:MAG: FkbM family methyltransferase [Vicingaceae bacterium]|nr:FkbM family methyltransferase [Vicingaceae bacterium]